MTNRLSVGESLASLLRREGVRHVFGIPGVHTLEFYRGLAETAGIQHITARHEQGAAFMADGYARASGRPGVACVITGPGIANAATAIASGYSDSVPMLILCGQLPLDQIGTDRGLPHQIIDQRALIRSITDAYACPTTQQELRTAVADAFASFASERPRPWVIELPIDLQRFPADAERPDLAQARPSLPAASAADLGFAEATIQKAQAPVLVVGGGAQGDGAAVLAFARKIGAPILMSSSGKGAVPDDDPLVVGSGLDLHANQALLTESDVAIVLGSRIDPIDVDHDRALTFLPRATIHVDIDAKRFGTTFEPTIAVHGSIASFVGPLSDHVYQSADVESAVARASAAQAAMRAEAAGLAGPYRRWIEAINEVKAPDCMVVVDVTRPVSYAAPYFMSITEPRSWLRPQGMNALGFAVPAAIGAKIASPDRSVLAIVGDGGFMFSGLELIVAVEQALPLPVIVWNDEAYGEIAYYMAKAGSPPLGTGLKAPDFLTLAASLGVASSRVDSPEQLGPRLTEAWLADGPTLLEVRPDVRS